jgi:hypothetical protein
VKGRSFIHFIPPFHIFLLVGTIAARQQSPQPSDPELQQIEKSIREAWQEADRSTAA